MPLVTMTPLLVSMVFMTSYTSHAVSEFAVDEQPSNRYSEVNMTGFHDVIDGEDVIVKTMYGLLRGRRREGDERAGGVTNKVDWFLGIPYAQPPVGEFRFKAPRPATQWQVDEVRDALQYASACPQVPDYWFTSTSRQNEDCLFLNIYAPFIANKTAGSDRRVLHPVMVYIHGGSYLSGTGNIFVGHILAQQGVIVVTINYRLNVFGFLSVGQEGLWGNYGLLDQLESLSWIQRNIDQFGGDPNKVTIFGNSAGASSVGFLSVSPLGKGLFQQAIMQSGSPLSFWAIHEKIGDLSTFTHQKAARLNCDRSDLNEMLTCLRNVPWKKLVTIVSQETFPSPFSTNFCPIVDGSVILASPKEIFKFHKTGVSSARRHTRGHSKMAGIGHKGEHVVGARNIGTSPVHIRAFMAGVVEQEMANLVSEYFLTGEEANSREPLERGTFERIVNDIVCNEMNMSEVIADIVRSEYMSVDKYDDAITNRAHCIDLMTDLAMLVPTVVVASNVAASNIPTYLFTFRVDIGANHDQFASWQLNHHQLELNYVFGCPFTGVDVEEGLPLDHSERYTILSQQRQYTDNDRRISAQIMTYWANFAKYGDPSGIDNSTHTASVVSADSNLTRWTRLDPVTTNYLRMVSDTSSMQTHLRSEFVVLWNYLVPRVNATLERFMLRNFEEKRWYIVWIVSMAICCVVFLLVLAILCIVLVRQRIIYR